MKKTILLIVTAVCVIISCAETKQKTGEAVHIIDLDSVEPEGVFEMSTLFKNVRTIILEENSDVVIGSIDGVQSFEDNLFVLDKLKAKKLFVFDRNGKYLRQIGSLGQGPGEYTSINDFAIDPNKKEIYIMDSDPKKIIHKYSITGQYIKSVKIQTTGSTQYKNLAFFNNKLYTDICHYDYNINPNKYLLMEIDTETGECKEFFSIDNNFGFISFSKWEFNVFVEKLPSVKYVERYMNTVTVIDRDSIYPYMTVKYKDWVQKSDVPDDDDGPGRDIIDDLLTSKSRAFYIQSYTEHENYIYFEYFKDDYKNYSVFYDKNTKRTSLFKARKNDLLFKGEGSFGIKIHNVNSKYAYDYLWYFRKDRFLEAVKNGKLELADNLDKRDELIKLAKLMDSGEERTIIFEYEFK